MVSVVSVCRCVGAKFCTPVIGRLGADALELKAIQKDRLARLIKECMGEDILRHSQKPTTARPRFSAGSTDAFLEESG